jgi:AcrR family transcriptional regulator
MTAARQPRSDAQRNRARVLGVAGDLFAERGPELTVAEVASAAGVGAGTIYRHFRSKDELAVAAGLARLKALVDAVREVSDDDPAQRLRRQLTLITERLQRDQGLFDAVGDRLAVATELEPLRRALRAAVRPTLRAAQQAGTVRDDVTVVDVVTLAGSLARPGRASEGHVGRHVVIALDGLAAPGRHPLPGAE